MSESSPLTTRFDLALGVATSLHRHQERKGTRGRSTSYVSHLLAVAGIAMADEPDEDVAIAALLHDGPEDQGGRRTPQAIRQLFGYELRTSSKPARTPLLLEYVNSMVGIFRASGFSVNLTHHLMHAIGSRLLGFTQELFDDTQTAQAMPADEVREMARRYPYIAEIAGAASDDGETVVGGQGCDDQFEFEFSLDLVLDGFERLRRQEQTSENLEPA